MPRSDHDVEDEDTSHAVERITERAAAHHEEIPWSADEDEITARVFDELDRQWRREEERAARQQSRYPSRKPR